MAKVKTIQDLLEKIHTQIKESDRAEVEKACHFVAEKAQSENGVYHAGLSMAEILLGLHCDTPTLLAGILYPCVQKFKIPSEVLITQFQPIVEKLIDGTAKMESIHAITQLAENHHQQKEQINNLRKMLLAMVDDIRVVLLKLAERLVIMKHLKTASKEQQVLIAKQTMDIYAPLANRLGVGHIKWQLEDAAFHYLNPEDYSHISKALNMRRGDRESFIEEMSQKLSELFHASGIEDITIAGRAKHIYSIYRKMQRKHVEFSEIYDTSAFRILVKNLKDCYTALGIIHSTWPHIPKEFDDYIAKPKPNGYRSIHTAVIGPHSIQVEIQIRTYAIHEESELGVAAHWKYKEGHHAESTYEDKIAWLREVMDWQKQVSVEETGSENLYSKIFNDRVYVFSPQGEVIDLPAGATPLDFAYYIHSSVGHHCRGAKINNILVPLTYRLKTGDQVHILTIKNGQPSRDWLNPQLGYLKTSLALSKVRHWFKRLNYQKNLEEGTVLWDKSLRKEGISKAKLNKIAHLLNFKQGDDLLAALGAGDIHASNILHRIKEEETEPAAAKPLEATESFIKAPQLPKNESHFVIEGETNLLTQLARCCKPIPGDAIIGYITKGRGIMIHQKKCMNIQRMAAEAARAKRLIEVQWGDKKPQKFPVDILIEARDRTGLIRDISNLIANEDVSILGISLQARHTDQLAWIQLTIEISDLILLTKMLNQLSQMPDVIRAFRN